MLLSVEHTKTLTVAATFKEAEISKMVNFRDSTNTRRMKKTIEFGTNITNCKSKISNLP